MKSTRVVVMWMVLFLGWVGLPSAGDYQLPDTGIHKSYDGTQEVPGPEVGQPFYGQDAQYDGPQPAYRGNDDGTVTDLNISLTWQQSDDGTTRTWQEACDYCDTLTFPAGGHSDWRIPDDHELISIVDYGSNDPAINNAYFSDCHSSFYWSKQTDVNNPSKAWVVNFSNGLVGGLSKSDHHYIRCVRGERIPTPAFQDNGDGTVTDSVAGLVWQQADDGNFRTWQDALEYCENLELPESGGYTDWRLPNARELGSILSRSRYNPAIDPVFVCPGGSRHYNTASTSASSPSNAWYIDFVNGQMYDHLSKQSQYYVRCVRCGLPSAGDYQLPDTGIHKSYDGTQEVPGPEVGQPFYGQDAQYDGPQPAYRGNDDGTVTDLNISLTWQQSDDGTTRTWQEACDYCDTLTFPAGGHSDWRIPDDHELISIVDYGSNDPAINNAYFSDCHSSFYWSKQTDVNNPSKAWVVNFSNGLVGGLSKSDHHYIRCVRGERIPTPAFQDNGDGTVTDSVAGLVWQQADDGNFRTWQDALEYCENLELPESGGYTDWRLPNARELGSILSRSRYNPAIDPVFVCPGGSRHYNTASTSASSPSNAWYIDFVNGQMYDHLSKQSQYYVRCVRCGSSGSFLPDIKANDSDGPITVTPNDPVGISISLDPGDKAGQNADWWIAVKTPFAPPEDWYTYVYPVGWMPGVNLCAQTGLFDLSPYEVLNMTLPVGAYTFYFALDDPDGAATGPWWGLDSVDVIVQ